MEALGINVCLNQRLTQRQLSSCLATLGKENLKWAMKEGRLKY